MDMSGTMKRKAGNSPTRGRTATREARRRQLIEATIDSIAKRGFTATTLAHITRGAKLSHGIVNFHFKSKEVLFVETFRFLAEGHYDNWCAALEKAGPTPVEQLTALVNTDFEPVICNVKNLAVWFAFWGETRSRPVYLEMCAKIDQERLDEFERLCRAIKEEGGYDHAEPPLIAKGLEAQIDGIWLSMLLYPKNYSLGEGKRTCFAFLGAVFPRHFPIPDMPDEG